MINMEIPAHFTHALSLSLCFARLLFAIEGIV